MYTKKYTTVYLTGCTVSRKNCEYDYFLNTLKVQLLESVSEITCIVPYTQDSFIRGTKYSTIYMTSMSLKTSQKYIGHTNSINKLIVYTDTLISGANDGTVKIWDVHTTECLHTFTTREKIECLFIIQDKFLVTNYAYNSLALWDVNTYEQVCVITEQSYITHAFAISDTHLITCCVDGHVNKWNFMTQEYECTYATHIRNPIMLTNNNIASELQILNIRKGTISDTTFEILIHNIMHHTGKIKLPISIVHPYHSIYWFDTFHINIILTLPDNRKIFILDCGCVNIYSEGKYTPLFFTTAKINCVENLLDGRIIFGYDNGDMRIIG